ncbi:MAG: hypothetical protein IIY06_03460 [Proteobacteria bacterium]|nr:hypothetical protein [Pseudomonadota bacterium]
MKRAIIRVIVLASFMIVFCGCHKRTTETDSQIPTHVQDAQKTKFESTNPSTDEGENVEAENDGFVDEEHHVNNAETVTENAMVYQLTNRNRLDILSLRINMTKQKYLYLLIQ